MKKKKKIVCVFTFIGIMLIVAIIILTFKSEGDLKKNLATLSQIKENFQSDIQELKEGKYNNLIYHEFKTSLENVEGVYNIEIQSDNGYQDRTFLENFEKMNDVIDKFFMEDFDKSYIAADFYISDEETIYLDYNDIEKECVDEKYNKPRAEFLFGNDTSNGGYMVQISEALNNVWFSRYSLGNIIPSQCEYSNVYQYISCKRQNEDVEINLKDMKIKLSEMEERVLKYLNNEFPIPVSEKIGFGIGDVRILNNGDYEGICFKVRRIYKGVPFEYGSTASSGLYNDKVNHERGEISYAVSEYPDTILAFGIINGTVVETGTISEIISLGNALDILSQKIGDNSKYDVYGVELVYRECEIPEEKECEIDAILRPKWKIITINQNDDKYTLFYIDVVTGEVTERFEYYYE